MRLPLPVLLALGLLCSGCRTSRTISPDVSPDVASWRARTPALGSVRAYAAALNRLNAGSRGPFDASDGLTLEEAEPLALLFNPELRVARLKARVPLLGAQRSGVPKDPRLELDLLRILQGVATPWVLAGGVKFTVPLSSRLARERESAFADASAALRAAHVAEWSLIVRLREAWNSWTATGERIALLEAYLGSVGEILEIARAQRDAEQIGATQLRVLEIEEVTRVGELDALRTKSEHQVLGLKALLGLTPYAEVALVPSFSPDPRYLDRVVEEQELVRVNLALALARAEFVAADRALRHEAAKRFPDLELGPLFETDEGIERLGAGVGIDLPLWNRNGRAIAEACATRTAARAAYQAKYEELIGQLARSRAECGATARRLAWLEDKVAPMADKQLADLQQLGALGDMDVLILKDAMSSVLETKFQLVEARLERAHASNRRRALVEPLLTPMARSAPR